MKYILITLIVSVSTLAHAAVIDWGASTSVSGDSDVSTAGTLVRAVSVNEANFGNTPTLNGVTFAGDPDPTEANGNRLPSWANFYSNPGVSADYNNLLQSAAYNVSAINLGGLIENQEYLIQIWSADSRASSAGRVTVIDGVTLDQNPIGSWITGTFTADGDTQSITLSNPVDLQNNVINAYQLRAIPEPATLGLIGMAGGAILFIRRKFVL